MIILKMPNNPAIISTANALNSIAVPSIVNAPGKPGTANRNNSSTNKNTGNEAKINNREILIIKIKTVKPKKPPWQAHWVLYSTFRQRFNRAPTID